MLPLVCNEAVALLFTFDLTRKATLNNIKEWYRQARGMNKVRLNTKQWLLDNDTYFLLQHAVPLLIGTKYDEFVRFSEKDQEEVTKQVRDWIEPGSEHHAHG